MASGSSTREDTVEGSDTEYALSKLTGEARKCFYLIKHLGWNWEYHCYGVEAGGDGNIYILIEPSGRWMSQDETYGEYGLARWLRMLKTPRRFPACGTSKS